MFSLCLVTKYIVSLAFPHWCYGNNLACGDSLGIHCPPNREDCMFLFFTIFKKMICFEALVDRYLQMAVKIDALVCIASSSPQTTTH